MATSPRPRAGLPEVWGIVNVTPDSFSDGGHFLARDEAVRHGLALVAAGADVLDVGGESTRPGAPAVPEDEERARVVPVIQGLVEAGVRVPISVDTRKASVAEAALDAGASIVNDVSAGTHDPALLGVAAGHEAAGVVLMHMQGGPETMQAEPTYDDVVAEVGAYLATRAGAAEAAGVARDRIWIDPGIGFGKTLEHNLQLMAALETLAAGTGVNGPYKVLLGASRKSFIGLLTGRAVDERLAGSLACVARAFNAGVHAVRVHDVAQTVDLLTVLAAAS